MVFRVAGGNFEWGKLIPFPLRRWLSPGDAEATEVEMDILRTDAEALIGRPRNRHQQTTQARFPDRIQGPTPTVVMQMLGGNRRLQPVRRRSAHKELLNQMY
ncbi:MAG: hypothetical protein AAF827_15050 [Cyanobacteria bacterium P01_D01_bin.6]